MINIFLFSLLCSFIANGQENDLNATKLLDEAKLKLDNLNSYSFDFNLTVHRDGHDNIQSGSYQGSGKKYKIAMETAQVISDGKYAYGFSNNNMDIQINDIDQSSQEIDIFKGPSSLLNFYNTGTFTYAIVSNDKISGSVIDFKPNDREGEIVKISLVISNEKMLTSCQIFMRDASNFLVEINNFKENPNLSSNLFEFNEKDYPGSNIEDLRLD